MINKAIGDLCKDSIDRNGVNDKVRDRIMMKWAEVEMLKDMELRNTVQNTGGPIYAFYTIASSTTTWVL